MVLADLEASDGGLDSVQQADVFRLGFNRREVLLSCKAGVPLLKVFDDRAVHGKRWIDSNGIGRWNHYSGTIAK